MAYDTHRFMLIQRWNRMFKMKFNKLIDDKKSCIKLVSVWGAYRAKKLNLVKYSTNCKK